MFLRHRNSNDVSKKMENCPQCGGLSEWFMELVLKTSDGVKPTVSSNLTASANNNAHPNEVGFVVLMQEREIRTIKCNSPVFTKDCFTKKNYPHDRIQSWGLIIPIVMFLISTESNAYHNDGIHK